MTQQLFIAFLIVFSILENTATGLAQNNIFYGFSISDATAVDYLNAQKSYKSKLIQDTMEHKKINGTITFPTEKSFMKFTDIPVKYEDDADRKEYKYLGQFKNPGLYLLRGNFWERQEYYLVDKKTGKQTIIGDIPLVSPNEKFIANIRVNEEGYNFYGVQLWLIENFSNPHNSISKYIELNQEIWKPADIVWESDNTLILKVISAGKDMYDSTGKLDINAEWHYLRLKIN